jgi:predicted HTH transcriptional regulator
MLNWLKKAASKFCEPPVQIKVEPIEIERKDLLIIEVMESFLKPHRLQDYKIDIDINTSQVYVRINDKSVLASKEMIKIMQTKSSGKSLEKYFVGDKEKIVFHLLDRNEIITVKELSKQANISERRASRTLIKLVRADILLIHQKDNGESFFTYAR